VGHRCLLGTQGQQGEDGRERNQVSCEHDSVWVRWSLRTIAGGRCKIVDDLGYDNRSRNVGRKRSRGEDDLFGTWPDD
jgi:hypothetical protein